MKSKHTPGPWFISSPGSADKLYVGPVVIQSHRTAFTNASTPDALGHIDNDTLYANARLIAAAPDLLEALQYLLPIAEKNVETSFGQDAIRIASAAIAKATGE